MSRPLAATPLLVLIFACTPDAGSDATAGSGPPSEAYGEVLFAESPPAWFDAYFTWLQVSPDGQRAVLDYRRLIDLRTGEELEMPGGLDVVFRARFDSDGTLMLAGRRGGEQGWYRPEAPGARPDSAPRDGTLPGRFVLAPSPDGERFAYWMDDDPATVLTVARARPGEPTPTPSRIALPAPVGGLAWMPDGEGLVAYSSDDLGIGTLHRIDLTTGTSTVVAEGLDGSSSGPHLAVSRDGRVAYLELAGPEAPDPEVRHRPAADRDMDIWAVDLETGARRPVAEAPGEQVVPTVAGDDLYWVSVQSRSEVAVLRMPDDASDASAQGMAGPPQVAASGVQLGTWRPDGRALGLTTGDWRLADWALNLDGGVVEIDEEGRPAGPVAPIITGYHEDFSPVWSPDGRWIAYHSHRSEAPVTGYSEGGSTDDIYLRRVDVADAPEIRLTDFGWEVGNPDWSPEGSRIVMDSWSRGGGASTWIIELDPGTGAFVDRTRVPQPEEAVGQPIWAAWSPVTDELAITYGGPDRTELWVHGIDGSGARRLASWDGGRFGGVDWTADGRAIVYAAPTDGRFRLYVVSRDGGEPRLLAQDEANLLHPQVSPDGRWVAVTRLGHQRRIVRAER